MISGDSATQWEQADKQNLGPAKLSYRHNQSVVITTKALGTSTSRLHACILTLRASGRAPARAPKPSPLCRRHRPSMSAGCRRLCRCSCIHTDHAPPCTKHGERGGEKGDLDGLLAGWPRGGPCRALITCTALPPHCSPTTSGASAPRSGSANSGTSKCARRT